MTKYWWEAHCMACGTADESRGRSPQFQHRDTLIIPIDQQMTIHMLQQERGRGAPTLIHRNHLTPPTPTTTATTAGKTTS